MQPHTWEVFHQRYALYGRRNKEHVMLSAERFNGVIDND